MNFVAATPRRCIKNAELLDRLRSLARQGPVTLVYSAHDEVHNDAVVLEKSASGAVSAIKRRRLQTIFASIPVVQELPYVRTKDVPASRLRFSNLGAAREKLVARILRRLLRSLSQNCSRPASDNAFGHIDQPATSPGDQEGGQARVHAKGVHIPGEEDCRHCFWRRPGNKIPWGRSQLSIHRRKRNDPASASRAGDRR